MHLLLTVLRGWVMVRAAGGCQQCLFICEVIGGTSSDYPLRRMWYLMYLFACFQRSFTKAVQRPAQCITGFSRKDCGLWTWTVHGPQACDLIHTMDVPRRGQTSDFHSSLNQADDQEQVQTAHIMQTFIKLYSTQAWLYVCLCICRASLCGMGEQRTIQWTKQYHNSCVIYKKTDCAEVMGLSKWGLHIYIYIYIWRFQNAKASKCRLKYSSKMSIFIRLLYLCWVISL